ncbi:hypothetical protein [Paenibacillus sp. NPDC058174]|uniref:hypothetical protein n=1 Tax=Paenibacillus sp. NPDC058174 TaxID=3346366 RepID=UPI0036DC8428
MSVSRLFILSAFNIATSLYRQRWMLEADRPEYNIEIIPYICMTDKTFFQYFMIFGSIS